MATQSSIVLIVDGVLIRDDTGVIAGIRQMALAIQQASVATLTKAEALMSELSNALDAMKMSVDLFIADVETLLTQPSPDVQAALGKLGEMKTAIDAADAEVRGALLPPPTP